MPTFVVIKQVVNEYAVEVEAEDATEAVLKAHDNEHDDGDLVDDYDINVPEWQVFKGSYPLGDKSEVVPTDAAKIKQKLGCE